MAAAHAFELPPHSGAPAEAIDAAAGGEVVYLTRNGHPFAAIVPADVAAEFEAAEDAEDIAAALAAREELGEPIPADKLWAELGL